MYWQCSAGVPPTEHWKCSAFHAMHCVHEHELHAPSAGSMQHACTRGSNTARALPAGRGGIVYASRYPPRPLGGLEAWRFGREEESLGHYFLIITRNQWKTYQSFCQEHIRFLRLYFYNIGCKNWSKIQKTLKINQKTLLDQSCDLLGSPGASWIDFLLIFIAFGIHLGSHLGVQNQ